MLLLSRKTVPSTTTLHGTHEFARQAQQSTCGKHTLRSMLVPTAESMMRRLLRRIDHNRHEWTSKSDTPNSGGMSPKAFGLEISVASQINFIKLIRCFASEFGRPNEKVLITHFTAIPDMIDNALTRSKLDHANGAMDAFHIAPHNALNAMTLGHM